MDVMGNRGQLDPRDQQEIWDLLDIPVLRGEKEIQENSYKGQLAHKVHKQACSSINIQSEFTFGLGRMGEPENKATYVTVSWCYYNLRTKRLTWSPRSHC